MLREATAVSIPSDVIFDILSRVPARCLHRFRCVSREWRTLTSDPDFLAAHKSRRPNLFLVELGNFLGHRDRDLRLSDLSGHVVRLIEGVGGSGIYPMASLDNFVCVIDDPSKAVHVVDLSTGEVLSTISGLEVTKQLHYVVRRKYATLGIGRTASSGVYKVVRDVRGHNCQVLTLGAGTPWRMKKLPQNYVLERYCSPVAINGIMYFLTEGRPGTLLCFDLESEQWKKNPIKGPWEVVRAKMWNSISIYITELNGYVCLVQDDYTGVPMSPQQQNSSTKVWILDDFDKSNWTKLYTIPTDTFGCSYYMPLRVMHGGEKLLVQCVSRYRWGLSSFQLCDPNTKALTDIMQETDYLPDKVVLCNQHL